MKHTSYQSPKLKRWAIRGALLSSFLLGAANLMAFTTPYGQCGSITSRLYLNSPDSESSGTQPSEQNQETDSIATAAMLEEIVVTGRRDSMKRADGEVFTLSKDAKNCGDPFRALAEIPLLKVDIVSQSVTTLDGQSPLILIDGRLQNSGIEPIDPRFIDKVEVIEVANAKYLELGYNKIINIILKRNTPLYTFAQLRTRHSVIPGNGFLGGSFETGTQKFAINASLFGAYTIHDKTILQYNEQIGPRYKTEDGNSIARGLNWSGNLMLKWMPNAANYFSIIVKGLQDFKRSYGDSEGYISQTDLTQTAALSTHSEAFDNLSGTLAALYYEHTFADSGTLAAFGYYNWASGSDLDSKSETIDGYADLYQAGVKSIRNQYRFTLDYDNSALSWGNISAGYVMQQTHNKTFNNAAPSDAPMSINLFDNYVHLTYSNRTGRVSYMASAGLEYMRVTAPTAGNDFWRPRASASLTWQLPRRQSLRLSYTLTNHMPATEYLATFNTSTDPWIRVEGNPFLTPYTFHNLNLHYGKNIGEFMVYGEGFFCANDGLINRWIYSDANHMVSTWRNIDNRRHPGLRTGTTWNHNNKTRINFNALYGWVKYNSSPYRSTVSLDALVISYFGDCAVQGVVSWTDKDYNAIGYTRFDSPITANVVFIWQPHQQWQFMAGVDYFAGFRKNTAITESDGYKSSLKTKFMGSSLHPFILISWTMRRHQEQSIMKFTPLDSL